MKHCAAWTGVVLLGLCACATSRPAEKKSPLARETGKPLVLTILGARYSVPERLDVDDHRDDPGLYFLSYLDRVTRCEGFFDLATTSSPGDHETAVAQRLEGLRAVWEERHIGVSQRLETLKLLGEDARVTVFEVAAAGQTARAALVDRHFAGANLSLQAYLFCDDAGLAKSQLEAVAEFVNSRQP